MRHHVAWGVARSADDYCPQREGAAHSLACELPRFEFQPANLVLFVNALVNDVHPEQDHQDESFWDKVWNLF